MGLLRVDGFPGHCVECGGSDQRSDSLVAVMGGTVVYVLNCLLEVGWVVTARLSDGLREAEGTAHGLPSGRLTGWLVTTHLCAAALQLVLPAPSG